MQPSYTTVQRIAQKEITLFFSSPIAYLFLAVFAIITLFVFFWGEAFFARNIADVRPLFEWMPVLLIFLCATLTMRLWSEERRHGTLEYLLTQAVPLWQFVVGKFAACIILLAIALVITLPLPLTVAILGDLDWGPVWAGYLATLLMGAAYCSIGLFVSSRSDNQIVSLITASALSGLLYLIGTANITDFFGNTVGEWLRLFSTGARFESIVRGVIDFRDLYYYLSLIAVFLTLNTLMLERQRWITGSAKPRHHQWILISTLVAANALGGNLWLGQLTGLRIDVTEGNQYSISNATRNYLQQLQEPLLIRGYFSGKTHPLLAPLVPQIRDLITEYGVAGQGKVRIEFIDPLTNPEQEQEANQKYAIQPVPFQIADRYQSAIVSSYFNVLIQYGDEYEVLGFQDLIEIQARNESDIDVQLRNPEHDLTRAIKKVLQHYQSAGNLFDTVKSDLTLHAYISNEQHLPKPLIRLKQEIEEVVAEVKQHSSGRLSMRLIDPSANDGKIGRQIAKDYGFQPMATSLFSQQSFYFYLTLSGGGDTVQIPLDDMSKDSFKRNLEAGIKRFAQGFTKTVALVTPDAGDQSGHSPYRQAVSRFSRLESFLSSELRVSKEDLSDGTVSGEADILLVLAPEALSEKHVFAIDQFLMKGGTVIAATSPFKANFSNRRLGISKHSSGLEKWLSHHGINIQEQLVLDPQNAALPIPVTRNIGGFQLQDLRMLDYPYFIDVRNEGLNSDQLISAELPQATLAWASPIQMETEKQAQQVVTPLLYSSTGSWLSESLDIMPKFSRQGAATFKPQGDPKSQLLGLVSQGKFTSYFAGKSSPLLTQASQIDQGLSSEPATENATNIESEYLPVGSIIEHSPESARLILFSSNDFLRDQVISMIGGVQQRDYLNTLQMVANAVDWSLEDSGLLSIRSRGNFNRTLPPMEKGRQMFWESVNYGLAAFLLILVALIERRKRRLKENRYLELFA